MTRASSLAPITTPSRMPSRACSGRRKPEPMSLIGSLHRLDCAARSPSSERMCSVFTSRAALKAKEEYWQKTNTCAELVHALTKAGFTDQVPQVVGGSGLINGPMNQPPPDPKHPCAKARPPKH